MGIRPSMQKMMLRHLKLAGASVCELGDQFCGTKSGRVVASKWYKAQGVARYVSIDANGLNGAVVFDLNDPLVQYDGVTGIAIESSVKHKIEPPYDIVTDFGTGEHVWNQDQVWRTLHDLCKRDGHIVFDRPTQGYGGHCFYLINVSVIAGFCHFNNYDPVWIGRAKTTRGELLRGILRKTTDQAFVTPQQGRYFNHVAAIMSEADQARGPDYKENRLRAHGLVGKSLPKLADETNDKGIWEDDHEPNQKQASDFDVADDRCVRRT